MKKIVCIIGARPQFIKHFPLEIVLRDDFDVITVHTGQHYDVNMSKVFFDELKMTKPTYQLNLTKSSHGGQTAQMLDQVEEILLKEKPKGVIIYGDTNSTLAGALAAVKLHIPIIHVEAGLRSYNMEMPEEVNRILSDRISELLFCSSEVGVKNLVSEGISKGVHVCGDLMKDALCLLEANLQQPISEDYIFATFHRPYNTDEYDRITAILAALNRLNKRVVFPVHPRTRKILEKNNTDLKAYDQIDFISPVGYIDSLSYQKFSKCVITDSGGIQKEAYWLKRKCITVRSETEWVETLAGKWNKLVFKNLSELSLDDYPSDQDYNPNLYGDGRAAEKMVAAIKQHL